VKKGLFCLLLVIGAGTGCLGLPGTGSGKKAEPPKPAVKPAPAPAPVTPDQVTEANAHEKAAALQEELEREAGEKKAPPKKPAPPDL
jgi:hypothetical protein